MHPMRAILSFCCAAFAAAMLAARGADAAPPAQTYKPQVAPKFTAGQAFEYKSDATFDSMMRVSKSDRRPQQTGPDKMSTSAEGVSNDYNAQLVAEAALARQVFKNGSLREAEFFVKSCQVIEAGGKVKDLVAPGSIIGALKQKDGQVAFAVDGKTPDPVTAARLCVLIPMGDDRNTVNELLNPTKPVASGATWAINEKAMLDSEIIELFPGVRTIAGGATLVKVSTDANSGTRGIVRGQYTLGQVTPPLPPNIVPGPSQVSFKFLSSAPINGGTGQYDLNLESLVHHFGATGNIEAGMSETDVDFAVHMTQNIHYTIDSGKSAPGALAQAPAEPPAPTLAPGLSSAPMFRPQPVAPNPAPGGNAPAQPAGSGQVAPLPPTQPAPETLPPLKAPDFSSPFSGAQSMSAPPPATGTTSK